MILSPSLLLFVISLVLFVVLFVLRRTGRIKEDTIKIAVDAAQLVALVVAVFSLIINSVPQQSSEVPKPVTIGIIELPSLTEASRLLLLRYHHLLYLYSRLHNHRL